MTRGVVLARLPGGRVQVRLGAAVVIARVAGASLPPGRTVTLEDTPGGYVVVSLG